MPRYRVRLKYNRRVVEAAVPLVIAQAHGERQLFLGVDPNIAAAGGDAMTYPYATVGIAAGAVRCCVRDFLYRCKKRNPVGASPR